MARKPDYDVKAMHKTTDEKAKIGSAWKNPDGSISVALNYFVVLSASKDLIITLFPEREKENGS